MEAVKQTEQIAKPIEEKKQDPKPNVVYIPFRKHPKDPAVSTKNIVEMAFRGSMPTEGVGLDKAWKRGKIIASLADVHEDSTVVELSPSESTEVLEAFSKAKWQYYDLFIGEVAKDFGYKLPE